MVGQKEKALGYLEGLHQNHCLSWTQIAQLVDNVNQNSWKLALPLHLRAFHVTGLRELCCEYKAVPYPFVIEFIQSKIEFEQQWSRFGAA